MTWLELVFKTQPENVETLEEWLQCAGAEAVTLKDAADTPIYEEAPGQTELWQHTEVIGLFPAEKELKDILTILSQLCQPDPLPAFHVRQIQDDDWETKWQDYLAPVCIGENFWVSPTELCDQITASNPLLLKLAPGLAFGTGAHPTTHMCLEALLAHRADYQDRPIVDYGCGSGILGLGALMLGAKSVIAVDISEQALIATGQNAALNAITDDQIQIVMPADDTNQTPVRCVVANILANPLISLQKTLSARVQTGGLLILSGILSEDSDRVLVAYTDKFECIATKHQAEWVCLVLKKLCEDGVDDAIVDHSENRSCGNGDKPG